MFTYGGVDTTNCGPVIDYRPVTKTGDDYEGWKFEIEGIALGKAQSTKTS